MATSNNDNPTNSVKVSDLPSGTSKGQLEDFFRAKRLGEKQVARVQMMDEPGAAIVQFGSERDAERVLARDEHQLQKVTLSMAKWEKPKQTSIRVTGLEPALDEECLSMYFDHPGKSGGGEVESVEILGDGEAKVTFFSEADCINVLGRGGHELLGCALAVSPWQADTVDTKTVLVTGLNPTTQPNRLELLFTNPKTSGGGPIENIQKTDDTTALVKFTDPGVAKRVVARSAEKKLTLQGYEINVSPLSNSQKMATGDSTKASNQHVPDTIEVMASRDLSKDAVRFYFENRKSGGGDVSNVIRTEDGDLLITFCQPNGVIQKKFEGKTLESHSLTAKAVSVSSCIRVTGFTSTTSSDDLRCYFENPRKSGGGPVTAVQLSQEEGFALVTFKDHQTSVNILSRAHKLEDKTLSLSVHYECLGLLEVDGSTLPLNRPKPVKLPVPGSLLKFLHNSPSNWQALEKEMEVVSARVDQTSIGTASITMNCTLEMAAKNRRLVATWEKDVQARLNGYLDMFDIFTKHFLQDTWNAIKEKLKSPDFDRKEGAVIMLLDNSTSVEIIGHRPLVEELKGKILKEVEQIEDDIERKKKNIREKKTLNHYELLFLKLIKFEESAKRRNGVTVKLNLQLDEIEFCGLPSEVQVGKLTMYENLEHMKSIKVTLSPSMKEFIQQQCAKRFVADRIRVTGNIAVWEPTEGGVFVYASSDKDLVASAHIIQDELVEKAYTVKPEAVGLLTGPGWQNMTRQMNEIAEGVLQLLPAADGSKVLILTTKHLLAWLVEMLGDFFTANTVLAEFSPLDRGKACFIKRIKGNDITRVTGSLRDFAVSIVIQETGGQPGIQLKGTEAGIHKAKLELEKLTGTIQTRRYRNNKPGYPKYLTSDKGREFLLQIEAKFSVAIVHVEVDISPPSEQQNSVADSNKGPIRTATIDLPQGPKISVVRGDMTDFKADAIVNAANGDLQHTSGLAGAITRKGGASIQEESDAFVAQNGRLLEGQVAVTGPGLLSSTRAIIHAVGPVWHGGTGSEEDCLFEAVLKSLETASSHHFTSIALPALSTGIFGYPLKEAVSTIVSAVKEFFTEERDSSLREVTLIDESQKTTRAFISALEKVFGEIDKKLVEPPSKSLGSLAWKPTKADSHLTANRPQSGSADVVNQSGMQISLVKGELAKQQVDVLVNSTSSSLNLKDGAISTSLLKAGGEALQTELSQSYPNGLTSSDQIAKTRGYKLPCKNVYHGALKQWNGGETSQTALIKFVESCLKEGDADGHSSIAFPALGTGNLKYPDQVVAKAMYQTAISYSHGRGQSSLNHIYFVVYPKSQSTVKAFEEESKKTNSAGTQKTTRRQGRKFCFPPEAHRPHLDTRSRQQADDKEEVFQLKEVRFSVAKGDITRVKSDAIVNSSNSRLALTSGATSQAILKAAGPGLKDECSKKVPEIQKKGVVVTGSGDLPCKHIVHVDANHGSSWKKRILKCLHAVNNLQLTSVSFPALGTGNVGLGPEQMAEEMFQAILDFQSEASQLSIQDIRLVVFQDGMVPPVKASLRKCYKKGGKTPKSWWRQITDVVKSWAGLSGDSEETAAVGFKTSHKEKAPTEVTLEIISDDTKSIDAAIQHIETALHSEVHDKTITVPWRETIKGLSEQQIEDVRAFAEDQDVRVTVEKRVGRIRLQGIPMDVMTAYDRVISILKAASEEIHQRNTSEFVAGIVQWYYLEGEEAGASATPQPKLVQYDTTVNRLLEEAYMKKMKKTQVKAYNGDYYCYDFESMEEYPEDDPTDRVKLIRKDVHGSDAKFEKPATWTPMASDEDLKVVTLNNTDAEYQSVANNFTAQYSGSIIQIDRIQNVSLYEQYMANKRRFERTNPGKSTEKVVWHGTSADTVPSINMYGFNRSYCGKNAVAFGNGVYFAVNAQYSASNTYSRPDPTGRKRMYQAKVLVGEYTQGNSGLVVPPTKSGTVLYDSVVDNASNPSIYVIFQDAQAYPEYLITFQ